jgi:hypothetical protein
MLSKPLRKFIAVFFLTLMLQSVITPTLTYALTAGPTAPEATSFEPVDTTDLVDLKTGDLTYGLPLLEVPGPAGGYPISLSYHAGILNDVEASWTGLGFSLNPGSITRLVNGYPDDHNVASNITTEFWEGGKTETATVGVSVGIANGVNASADLVFANDTYKGHGVGAGFGMGLQLKSGVGIGVYGGVSPYGESYSSAGLNLGIGAPIKGQMALQGNIGLNLNSDGKVSGNISGGVSWYPPGAAGTNNTKSMSLMDASISTSGGRPSLSVAGVPSIIHQQNGGKESSVSHSWQVDVPLYYFNLRLGRSYHRYWIDNTDNAWTYGSLYLGGSSSGFNSAFDTYDAIDPELDLVDHPEGEKVLGGSFPDVDNYIVTAQGLSGSIQPYHFQQELYKQDKKDKDNHVLAKTYALGSNSYKRPAFNFVNDFSNRFEQEPGDFSINNGLNFSFTENYVTGQSGADGFVGNHLAGSKHVEWFTNNSILNADPNSNPYSYGFINAIAEGFTRDHDDQIGGFSITNSSGVVYHYALPAYSYDEVIKMQNTTKQRREGGLYYNEIKKPEKYAHTWHLTSITGPDFIDRNQNGLADSGDWGYWVRFEYKKWISDYKWRNPGEGLNKDLDSDFDFYSAGKKELYALTKVVTESHVATFSTSVREDSREVVDLKTGGFDPTPIMGPHPSYEACKQACLAEGNSDCEVTCKESFPDIVTGYTNIPRATFKLDEIKLYKAEDYLNNHAEDSKVLRAIKLDYDYSLAPNTPNSYDIENFQKKGKLTLRSVNFLGKGKVGMIPPILFDYAKNPSYKKDFSDMWGFYKSDYVANDNKNISKLTTPTAAHDVDAWSLTSITSSLGSKLLIDYQSDDYNTPSLYKNNIVSIESLEVNPSTNSIKLSINPTGYDLTKVEELIKNSQVEFLLKRVFRAKEYCVCQGYDTPPGTAMGNYYTTKTIAFSTANIISVTPTSVEFTDNDLYSYLTEETESSNYTETTCFNAAAQQISPQIRILKGELVSGNIVVRPNIKSYGGGIRVKEISVKTETEEAITTYDYTNGVTTYEPVNFGKINFDFQNWSSTTWTAELKRIKIAKETHNQKMYKSFSSIIAMASQIPGPGVMYEKVKVGQKTKAANGETHDFPNYVVYDFEAFNEGMIGFENSSVLTSTPTQQQEFAKIKTRSIVLKDYTSRIGNLKSVVTYASNGDPVSSIENTFLHSDLDGSLEENKTQYESALSTKVKNQGLIEQSFARARVVLYKKDEKIPYPEISDPDIFDSDQKYLLGVIAKKESFPSIQIGQRTKNFKTGVVSTTENLSFDFYSGELLKVITNDSYGNRYLSCDTPAYHKYSEMGLKIYNKVNKNMITQSASRASFLVDYENIPTDLISASVQTWSKEVPVLNATGNIGNTWRKQSGYQWNGPLALNNNGSYSIADFNSHDFDWSNVTQNDHWEKTDELTLYDVYTHALEAKDMNGNFAATLMDNKQQKVIASASNASYNQIAYSGAENYSGSSQLEGHVTRGQGSAVSTFAHTGDFSLLVGTGQKGFNYTVQSSTGMIKKYRASVWMYAPGISETQAELDKIELYYSIGGQEKKAHPTLQKNKSKSWYLLNIDVDPAGASSVYIGVRNNSLRGVYFDDFRVHPLNASLNSFVYDSNDELTYILDANNFYTKFEYDAIGRLVRTSKELLNFDFGPGKESFRADAILKEVIYNYGN